MSGEHVRWPIATIGDAGDAGPERIGVKGWYLEQLGSGGFHTAPAFVVEADAYLDSVRLGRIDHRLTQIWWTARTAAPSEIPMLARKARHLVSSIEFSSGFRDSLQAHLDALEARQPQGRTSENLRVAVRSSAIPGAVSGPECAGVHSTYLGVTGVDQVMARIHSCWASMFGERALTMRAHGLGDGEPAMAVIVQTMIDANKSGIITPTRSPNEMLVEATFGLGEPVVSGAVEPDRYVIDRQTYELSSVTIGRKEIVLRGRSDAVVHEFADSDHLRARVLDDTELGELSILSRSIDQHFGAPHEIEWSIDRFGVHPLQARPITFAHDIDAPSIEKNVTGVGIGHGWATGRVRVVDRYEDLGELSDGEILVTTETTPEWSPHIRRAAAVITNEGDASCHAARVAAEAGLPAIVGTRDATTALETGRSVTVDASRGRVFSSVTFSTSP